MKKKNFSERRDYEAVADASQSKTIGKSLKYSVSPLRVNSSIHF